MSRSCRTILRAAFFAFSAIASLGTPLAAQQITPRITIAPGVDLGRWYDRASGYHPDPTAFGAYVMTPIGETLYLGFGTAEPTARDGAVLAGYDGASLRALGTFSEQGLHQIVADGQRLVIAGTDPSGSDDWSSGNVYLYEPGQPPTKFRSQPNVIHTWGLHGEGENLYATAAAHTGDGLTPEGLVLKSTNSGRDWRVVSSATNFSVQDIFRLDGDLYATRYYADQSWLKYHLRLARSTDDGRTWQEVSDIESSPTIRFVDRSGARIGADSSRTRLISIDGSTGITTIDLPFRLQKYYHSLATASDGALYAITDDRRLMRSRDLESWEEVSRSTHDMIAVTFWPARRSIVVSEQGVDGTIWMVGEGTEGRGQNGEDSSLLLSGIGQ